MICLRILGLQAEGRPTTTQRHDTDTANSDM
jgi:hypothetical protein